MTTHSIDTDTTCPMADLNDHLPSWPEVLQENAQQASINELFADDPLRAKDFSCRTDQLFLDYSKSHLSRRTKKLLLKVAKEAGITDAIEKLLSGAEVNTTEQRPAWHSLLRAPTEQTNASSGVEAQAIKAAQTQMAKFVGDISEGIWLGFGGQKITDVVNIGIGGSDLGPRMVSRALCDYHQPGINVHFVANIDGAEIHHTLKALKPAQTLFIVASKSFTTQAFWRGMRSPMNATRRASQT